MVLEILTWSVQKQELIKATYILGKQILQIEVPTKT